MNRKVDTSETKRNVSNTKARTILKKRKIKNNKKIR